MAVSQLVSIERTSMIVPATPTYPQSMFLSFCDILLGSLSPYLNRIFFYDVKLHDYDAMLESLKRSLESSLVPFFPLAGRLAKDQLGRLEIDCNDAGVEFVEAVANVSFDELKSDGFEYRQLFSELARRPKLLRSDYLDLPIMSVQVTKFQGDGMALCVSISHSVVDGQSFYDFMRGWAGFCKGEPLSEAPQHMRTAMSLESLMNSQSAPTAPNLQSPHDNDPMADEQKVVQAAEDNMEKKSSEEGESGTKKQAGGDELEKKVFSFSKEAVQKIKKQASEEDNGQSYTTFESFTAHWWKALIELQGWPEEQLVMLAAPINCRGRLPSIPANYFGNCIWFGVAFSTAGEVCKSKLSAVAGNIHNALTGCMTRENITTNLINAEKQHKKSGASGGSVHEDPVGMWSVVDSPKFGVYEIDFGMGKPCAMRVPGPWVSKDVHVTDGRDGLGSLHLFCSLPPHLMHRLQHCPIFLPSSS